jgi:hypothetical protein
VICCKASSGNLPVRAAIQPDRLREKYFFWCDLVRFGAIGCYWPLAAFLAGGWLREIHARSKRPGQTIRQPEFNAKARRRSDAKKMFSSVHSALPIFPGPFPLQNVKEQARGRPTGSILPRYYGTANKNRKIFSGARAVFVPGGEFSGGFFSRRGTTPQMPIY